MIFPDVKACKGTLGAVCHGRPHYLSGHAAGNQDTSGYVRPPTPATGKYGHVHVGV